MILESTRTLADWYVGVLKDALGADQSVNTWIPKVPRDGKDPQPPLIKAVLDPTRDKLLARGVVSPAARFPILLVGPSGAAEIQGQVRTLPPAAYRDAERATFIIAYVTEKEESAQADAEIWYTLRALTASTQQLLLDSNQPVRIRNGTEIRNCQKMRWGPTLQSIGAHCIRGVLELELQLRDGQP